MSVFLCVSILILTLFGAELQASVDFHANLLKNAMDVKIMAFGISIMRVKVSFIELDLANKYVWIKINKKSLGIALTTDRDNKDSILNYMTNPIINAIDFKYFDLFVNAGICENPFMTAMLLQTVRMGFASVVSYIKNRQDLETDKSFVMNYFENVLKIGFFGIISITLANIIFSFFVAIVRKIRTNMKTRRKNDNKYRAKTH